MSGHVPPRVSPSAHARAAALRRPRHAGTFRVGSFPRKKQSRKKSIAHCAIVRSGRPPSEERELDDAASPPARATAGGDERTRRP